MSNPSRRNSLQFILAKQVIWIFGLLIFAATALVARLVDETLHDQIDMMLAQVAQTEADGVMSEYEEGLHVHDTAVWLPSFERTFAAKYTLIHDHSCRVLVATDNIDVRTLPKEWCTSRPTGSLEAFDTSELTEPARRLRAVSLTSKTSRGEVLYFVTAIDHAVIDDAVSSLHRRVIGIGLALVVLVIILSLLLARTLTRDLESLERACTDLARDTTRLARQDIEFPIQISERAPREFGTLANTISTLVLQLNKTLQSQNRFIAEAAHELRTPLTALRGEIEVTLRRERSGEEYREALELVLEDAGRLQDLSERLLEAARTQNEALSLQPLLLSEVIDATLKRMRGALENIEVSVELEEPEAMILADEDALSRVLENLLSNVARHANARHVTLTAVEEATSPKQTQTLTLFIRDDGVGVPAQIREDLFTPLPSGRRKGHGLGLYIAHRLMKKQGGELDLEPSDEGTCWRITLRRSQAWRRG